MAIPAGAKLLRITATTINFLVRSVAVSGGVQRVIARQALEAATMIDLRRGLMGPVMAPVSINLDSYTRTHLFPAQHSLRRIDKDPTTGTSLALGSFRQLLDQCRQTEGNC